MHNNNDGIKSEIDPIIFVLPPVELTAAQAVIYREVPLVIKAAAVSLWNGSQFIPLQRLKFLKAAMPLSCKGFFETFS